MKGERREHNKTKFFSNCTAFGVVTSIAKPYFTGNRLVSARIVMDVGSVGRVTQAFKFDTKGAERLSERCSGDFAALEGELIHVKVSSPEVKYNSVNGRRHVYTEQLVHEFDFVEEEDRVPYWWK